MKSNRLKGRRAIENGLGKHYPPTHVTGTLSAAENGTLGQFSLDANLLKYFSNDKELVAAAGCANNMRHQLTWAQNRYVNSTTSAEINSNHNSS